MLSPIGQKMQQPKPIQMGILAKPNQVKPVSRLSEIGKKLMNADIGGAFGMESLNNTNAGKIVNTVLGIPKAAKDVLLPTRGYTEPELRAAKPTLSQTLQGLPKVGAEMATGLGELANKIPGYSNALYKATNNKTGAKLSEIGQKIVDYGIPKTVEEAKAMRGGDVLSAVVPVGRIKKTNNFMKGNSEAFQKADAEVTTHMGELSKAGERIHTPDGVVGVSSSFPKWVPDHLRSNDLFKQVLPHYEAGTTPKGVRQQELLDVMQKEVSRRATEYGHVPGPHVRKMTRSKEIPSLEKAGEAALAEEIIPSPRRAPVPGGETKPAGSLGARGQRASLEVDGPPPVKPESFDSIVARTPVQKKVNAVDWLRTPDRVMEKIGFGKQAKQLRQSYENYVKELPKNIDKITGWYKQVGSASNERLFDYLDGKPIKLNPTELKVANEMRAWLKEWAVRLKLPADNTITHYITHIFDKELIAKEFDEDLAKIIGEKLPGSVYDPFLLKRLGAKGYKRDVWAALDAYVKRATRKANMDDALQAIQDKAGSSLEFSNIEATQYKYIQKYIHSVNMRPTDLDNAIDNTVKSAVGYKFGQRPVTYLTKLLRQMTYRGMLGLNPGSALRNLSQGINTYAVLGEKYTTIGYAKLFSKQAHAELAEQGVLKNGFIEDRVLNATKKTLERIDKGLWLFFDTAERINRGAAYFGAKSKALAKGMPEEEAIAYAKEIVRKTQFAFDPVDQPLLLSSDIAKTLGQFQTYTLKQTEFLAEMVKKKDFVGMIRYAVAGLVFVHTIGKAFGMEPKELIPMFRFDTPPSLKFPVEVTKAAVNAPNKYGQPRTAGEKLEDVGKSLIGLIPGGTQMKKTYEGYQAMKDGQSSTSSGVKQFEVGGTPLKNAQAVIFGKYAGEDAKDYFDDAKTPEQRLKAEKAEASKGERDEIRPTYDQVQALIREGKTEEAKSIVDGLTDTQYEAYKKIRSTERAKNTEAVRLKLQTDPGGAVAYVRSLDKEEGKRILELLTDEEYAIYEAGKSIPPKPAEATEAKPERGILELAGAYAKAFFVDPGNAAKGLLTREKLGKVEGNLVELQRFYGRDYQAKNGSEAYIYNQLKEMGIDESERSNYRLEHIVPVSAGGDSSPSNLRVVHRDIHESWTPIDILIGGAVQSKRITRKQAEAIARDFKNGRLTAAEVKEQLTTMQ